MARMNHFIALAWLVMLFRGAFGGGSVGAKVWERVGGVQGVHGLPFL